MKINSFLKPNRIGMILFLSLVAGLLSGCLRCNYDLGRACAENVENTSEWNRSVTEKYRERKGQEQSINNQKNEKN